MQCSGFRWKLPGNTKESMTPARDPKLGWAYRTGSEGGNPELRNSMFRIFDKIAGKRFLREFLKNPSVESVSGEHAQFSPKDFPSSSTRVRFFLEYPVFLLIVCADFELGADCLPSDGLRLPGSGLKGRLVPLGFDLVL